MLLNNSSTLVIIKILLCQKYIPDKVCILTKRWLRLKLSIRPIETAWENAQSPSSSPNHSSNNANSQSNWPFVIFLSALIGAPYLTWKLLSSSQQNSSGEKLKPPNPLWVEGRKIIYCLKKSFYYHYHLT